MLSRTLCSLALLASALAAPGCMSQHCYVGDKLPRVALSEIQPGPSPVDVRLLFEFQTNGAANPDMSKQLRPKVIAAIAETGVFKAIHDAEGKDLAHLEIVLNNTGDASNSEVQGAVTGLTLGLAGSLVTDHYAWRATWTTPGHDPIVKNYEHEMHTAIGNHSGPAGLEPLTMDQAADQIIQQLVRITLRDLQAEAKVSG